MSFPQTYSLLTNYNITQDLTIFVGLVVSGVLDVSRLEETAKELVSRWPVLGGKLNPFKSPHTFTTGTTVDFASRTLTQPLSEVCATDFRNLSVDKPTYTSISPETLFHYDTTSSINLPVSNLFALRVTVLQDATLLGFRLSHHLADGQSTYDVIRCFRDLLSKEPIPRLTMPPDFTTPLSELVYGEDSYPPNVVPSAPYIHPAENFALGHVRLLKYIVHAVYNRLSSKFGFVDAEEEKFIHLPEAFIKELHSTLQAELNASDLPEAGLQLTKNDCIMAWFLRRSYAADPAVERPLDVMYNFNYRQALQPPPPGEIYLHNSYYNMRTRFPSLAYIQTAPLSHVALAVRLCCIRNRQPSAVRAALHFFEENAANPLAPMPADADIDFLPIFSAWTTFEYNGMDFSAALLKEGGARSAEDGKVVFTQPHTALPFTITIRPYGESLKDGRGGYWVKAKLLATGWKGHDQGL